MIKSICFKILLIITFWAFITDVSAQIVQNDSVTTSFRKGRYLIGLSGSIGSSSTSISGKDQRSDNNHYGIEGSFGIFLKDLISLGFTVDLERLSIEDNINNSSRTGENLFIGPTGTYFFSKNSIGSLFFNLSPGLVLYRDESTILIDEELNQSVNKGEGFGLQSSFGYAYCIYDHIILNISLNWSTYWINAENKTIPDNITNEVKLTTSYLAFSFGFKIFVD